MFGKNSKGGTLWSLSYFCKHKTFFGSERDSNPRTLDLDRGKSVLTTGRSD